MNERHNNPGAKRGSRTTGLDSTRDFEQELTAGENARYVMRLYVTGLTRRSQQAIDNIRKLCDQHLQGRFDLDIIDVYKQPALAKTEQIVAAPTLVKKLPLPLRRIIGDMSDSGRVLIALGLTALGE